jgi:hypothetical protein
LGKGEGGEGILRYHEKTMITNNSQLYEVTPLKFYLSKSFPNPFREKTIIKYCLAYKVKVKIEIINSEDKLIKKLVDDEKAAGNYEVEFIPGNLAEGAYFCQFQAGSFIDAKEINLIK